MADQVVNREDSPSSMAMFMALMYRFTMLTDEDLEHFSENLGDHIRDFSSI